VLRHSPGQHDSGQGDHPADQLDRARDLPQPGQRDSDGGRRDQVEADGDPSDVHPRHGVGPQHEPGRRRRHAEEDRRADGRPARVRPWPPQRPQQRPGPGQDEHGAGPHRVGGHLEAGVPGQQRLLRGVEDRLEHRRGQHDQRRRTEPEPVRGGDQRGAGQRHRAAGPASAGRVLAQERHRQQAGVYRRGRHQQAGRARGHHPLPGVEQQLVAGHPGQPAQRDQRQVPALGPADPHQGRGQRQHGRRDRQPGHGQARGAQPPDRDGDGREGAGPEQHRSRGGETGGLGGHETSLVWLCIKVQLQNLR
jgi:hypothetical protein